MSDRGSACSGTAPTLSDAQLLAILLRTGNQDKSAVQLGLSLIESYRALSSIEAVSLQEMKHNEKLKGIGATKLAQLKAAFELGRRLLHEENGIQAHFSPINAVFSYFAPSLLHYKKECFIALLA